MESKGVSQSTSHRRSQKEPLANNTKFVRSRPPVSKRSKPQQSADFTAEATVEGKPSPPPRSSHNQSRHSPAPLPRARARAHPLPPRTPCSPSLLSASFRDSKPPKSVKRRCSAEILGETPRVRARQSESEQVRARQSETERDRVSQSETPRDSASALLPLRSQQSPVFANQAASKHWLSNTGFKATKANKDRNRAPLAQLDRASDS